MNDRGEKIVFMAQEILKQGIPDITPPKKHAALTMSFKTLCLATILAAVGGGVVTNVVRSGERPLNRYERVEIQALIFYASKVKGINEDDLRRDVEKQTGVFRLEDMTAEDFPVARRYLQEKAQ